MLESRFSSLLCPLTFFLRECETGLLRSAYFFASADHEKHREFHIPLCCAVMITRSGRKSTENECLTSHVFFSAERTISRSNAASFLVLTVFLHLFDFREAPLPSDAEIGTREDPFLVLTTINFCSTESRDARNSISFGPLLLNHSTEYIPECVTPPPASSLWLYISRSVKIRIPSLFGPLYCLSVFPPA